MVNRSERNKLCTAMADVCEQRQSGDDFVELLWMIKAGEDPTLHMAIGWLISTWDPEWPQPRGFDQNAPPYRLQRQMALLRRFLLAEQTYKWPDHAFVVDGFPTLRLWATGITVCLAMMAGAISLSRLTAVPVFLACVALAIWLIVRERSASERDLARMRERASAYGDPKWWPFLNGEEYHRAGPSRSRIAPVGVPPTEPGGLILPTDCAEKRGKTNTLEKWPL